MSLDCAAWPLSCPGTAYRLQHPQAVGPLIGTLVQLAGLVLALIGGVATVVVRFLRRKSL